MSCANDEEVVGGTKLNINIISGPTNITLGSGGMRISSRGLTIDINGPITFNPPLPPFQVVAGLVQGPSNTIVSRIRANPKVFLDLTVDGEQAGRIVIELFKDTTPKTAGNFRALCTGEKGVGKSGKQLHYKGSRFHCIVPGKSWLGGDIISPIGRGTPESIYGDVFDDENFDKRHDRAGVVSMNAMDNSNGFQFQICLKPYPIMDDVHVVFGQVIEGLDLMKSIEGGDFSLFPCELFVS